MSARAPAIEALGELRKNWGWLLVLGLVSLALGIVGLGYCFALTLAGVLVFGWLILITGAVEVVQAFKCRGWKSVLWQLFIALLHVLAGIVVISDPLLASWIFTLFLAVAILVGGATRIVVAFQHRDHAGWPWLLVGGAVSVALGAMIAAGWPGTSFFLIGLFIAVELIANGVGLVTLALAARSAGAAPGLTEQHA